MNKLSVALFTVLFLAVAGIYILFFLGKPSEKSSDESAQSVVQTEGIAFVNIDTVIYKFDMFFDRRDEFLEKQTKAESELTSKRNLLEKNVKDFNDKLNKGLITRAQAAEIQQTLAQQEQDLANLYTSLQSNLSEEEQVMNRQIVDYITTYLDEHKSEYNYQYILSKNFGSPVLFGDPGLDITQKVLLGLNEKYKAEKK